MMFSFLRLVSSTTGVIRLRKEMLCCFMLFTLVILVSSVSADTAFEDEFDDADIEGDIEGCNDSCSYQKGELILTGSAVLTLDEVPEGTIIHTNGARVELPGGDSIVGGTLDTSTMTLQDGEVELSLVSSLDMTFQETAVTPQDGVSVRGDGTIENGKIVFIEDGEITLPGSSDSVSVENLHNPTFVDDAEIDGNIRSGRGKTYLTGDINSNTKIEGRDGHITMDGEGTFYYANQYLSCSSDCHYSIHGTPSMIIEGSGTQISGLIMTGNEEQERIEDGEVVVAVEVQGFTTERTSTRTFSFEDGEVHTLEGQAFVGDNSLMFLPQEDITFPTVERRYSQVEDDGASGGFTTVRGDAEYPDGTRKGEMLHVQSIDGRYVSSDNVVQVFFDSGVSAAGNYMIIKDDDTYLSGDGYTIAFGDTSGGNPDDKFPYTFTQQGPFEPHTDEASPRIIVDMNGGAVSVNPSEIHVDVAGVTVVNGINAITYSEGDEENEMKYDYTYMGCSRQPSGDSHASCGEVDVDMTDGGLVNVMSETGIDYRAEPEDVVLVIDTNRDGELEYDVNTGEVYVLGYKGGSFAEAAVGSKKANKDWGHVGLLYYVENSDGSGQWMVAEQTGVSLEIKPIEESLFAGKLDGVYEIQSDDQQAMISFAEENAGNDYKHFSAPYVTQLDDPGMTCSSFCSMAMSSTSDIKRGDKGRVSFKDMKQDGTRAGLSAQIVYRGASLFGEQTTTPRKLLSNNPYLVQVYELNDDEYKDPFDLEEPDDPGEILLAELDPAYDDLDTTRKK
jgi:hypothetical protein